MSVSKALERLLRIRRVEEEQRRLALEAAVARLQALKQARDQAAEMERQGRARVTESACSGELADRVAGMVQSDAARARVRLLAPRIASAEVESFDRRREFLEKRVERRQAATLIEQAAARDELEQGRRTQGDIDDQFAARTHRQAREQAGISAGFAEFNERENFLNRDNFLTISASNWHSGCSYLLP